VKTVATVPSDLHRAFREDVVELMRKYAGRLTSEEVLALAAHLVGQVIAMQDQRVVTVAMAMEIVQKNIEQGNREAVGEILLATRGTA
jgi:hypothetical protein